MIVQSTAISNYPYGFKKTSASFKIEFNAKKGFRSVFQTINPKTNQLNKPKYGIYYHFGRLKEDEKGHIHFDMLNFFDEKDNKLLTLSLFDSIKSENYLFTDEMKHFILDISYAYFYLNARYDFEKYGKHIEEAKQARNDLNIDFLKIFLD